MLASDPGAHHIELAEIRPFLLSVPTRGRMVGVMAVEGLLQDLLDSRHAIAERVVSRIRSEMPSFEAVPREEHVESVAAALELLVRARMENPEASIEDSSEQLSELGERRSRQGVPVDDLLRSWRIGIEEATAHARLAAEGIDAQPAELFDLFQESFGLADGAMVSVADGHKGDSGPADPGIERRTAFVQGALLGTLSTDELHSGFASMHLDPLVPYQAFRARGDDPGDLEALEAALEIDPVRSQPIGVAAVLENELTGFCSQPPQRGALTLIALGPEVAVAELPSSYRAAGRVLAAAETFGMLGVHDLTSAGLHAAVIEDAELGDALAELLVDPVRAQSGGEEVLASVREWLASGMRVDPAAERLFIHPNTVRYRLRRYEALTGAELAETEDAFRVWWVLQRDLALKGSQTDGDAVPTPPE